MYNHSNTIYLPTYNFRINVIGIFNSLKFIYF